MAHEHSFLLVVLALAVVADARRLLALLALLARRLEVLARRLVLAVLALAQALENLRGPGA